MKSAIILLALTSIAFAQGPLTPPGPPGPTMKSLDEIEPRIPLNQTNTPGDATCVFKITRPGSYILTGNLKPPAGEHGILIALLLPGVVEVDLMGFMVDGSDAGAGASGIYCSNDGLLDEDYKPLIRNGTIRNFAGSACLATSVVGTIEVRDLHSFACTDGVAVPGRLLMQNVSISGGSGMPIQMGSDSVLESVSVKYAGSSRVISGSGSRHRLSGVIISSFSFGASQTSTLQLGPDSVINGLRLRIADAIFTGPILANTSGSTEVSGLSMELQNVTAPTACNSYSWGASNLGLLGTTYGGNGQITAQNCTFTSSVVTLPPLLQGYAENDTITMRLAGTTTTPSVVRVEADNFTATCDIFVAGTATVSGAVIDVAASGTTIRANIRGGSVGVRLSSGSGNTVEGCNLIGLLVPGVGIQISNGVTNSLVRNNRASRLAAGGVLVQNNGGSTNFSAPVLSTPAMLTGNTNPFANVLH